MAAIKRRSLRWMRFGAISTTSVFIPATEWEDIAGITAARSVSEMRGKTGNANAQLGFRPPTTFEPPTRPPSGSAR